MAVRRLRPGRQARRGDLHADHYITTAKLNVINNPQAWLAAVLTRIADHPRSHLDDLLPWHWKASDPGSSAAA